MTARLRRAVTAAPFWRRLLADLLDLIVLAATGLGLHQLGAFQPTLPPRKYGWIDYGAELISHHLSAFQGSVGLALTIGLIYTLIFRQVLGRTPGEWALRLKLVDHDGLSVGPLQSLAHALGTLLGVLLLLTGYTWAAVSRDRQGLAEALSRTLLIHGEAKIDRPRSQAAPGYR